MINGERSSFLRRPPARRFMPSERSGAWAKPGKRGKLSHPSEDRIGVRAQVPCMCGLPCGRHSPVFPHRPFGDSECRGWQQNLKFIAPVEERAKHARILKFPPLFPVLEPHSLPRDEAPQLTHARLLDGLRAFSRQRTRDCRSKRCSSEVQITRTGDSIALRGLVTCGSVWACPCCAAKIYATRAGELAKALHTWPSFEPQMLTLTVRHAIQDHPGRLQRGLRKAWSFMWRGRAGMQRRKDWKLRYWIRALEVTHGPNGWHPHIHAIVFCSRELTEADRVELAKAWRRAVVKMLGFRARPSMARGVNMTPARKAQYLAKMGLEISAITKEGRKDSRSPWQIARAAVQGDREAAQLWQVYAKAMHGARQLTWSRGARKRFGVAEKTDEEIAEENPPAVQQLMIRWTGDAWDRNRMRPRWLSRVYAAALSDLPMQELGGLPDALATGPPGGVRAPPPLPDPVLELAETA